MENQYNISGKVVDSSQNPIKGVNIEYDIYSTKTDKNGDFTLNIKLDTSITSISISSPQYNPKTKPILTNSEKVKSNLGVIILQSNEESYSDEITSFLPPTDVEINQLVSPNINFEQLQQKKLRDLIKTLKYVLVPIILKMLLNFGISRIEDAFSKKSSAPDFCPNPDKLKKLIDKRNKLVKQLNITFTIIDNTLKALGILQGILILAENTQRGIILVPLPSPPAVPILAGGIGTEIQKYKTLNTAVITILFILRTILDKILRLLETLDFQIQSCTDDTDLETLNPEVVEQINALNRETPPSSFEKVNGFSFDIETERTTNEVKRKRAVAKNSKGVILLRGEWSFSSSTRILIEELAFFIKTNDLKAD